MRAGLLRLEHPRDGARAHRARRRAHARHDQPRLSCVSAAKPLRCRSVRGARNAPCAHPRLPLNRSAQQEGGSHQLAECRRVLVARLSRAQPVPGRCLSFVLWPSPCQHVSVGLGHWEPECRHLGAQAKRAHRALLMRTVRRADEVEWPRIATGVARVEGVE